MNRKGFTLVELLSVIAIITIMMLVSFPNFSSLTNKANKKYDNTVKVLLKNAAKIYVNNNRLEIDEILQTSEKYCIPIGKLMAYEYLDSDLKSTDGNLIDKDNCINISKTLVDGKVNYEYDINTTDKAPVDSNGDTIDYIPPFLYLKENCNQRQTWESIDSASNFAQSCIGSVENTDTTVTISYTYKVIETKRLRVEYIGTDLQGNKSLPLIINVTIQ